LRKLGWEPIHEFESALAQTVAWYRDNEWWWRQIRDSEEFKRYYEANYAWRLKTK
jgi:dTDP-glucose 4,6-dehydratase